MNESIPYIISVYESSEFITLYSEIIEVLPTHSDASISITIGGINTPDIYLHEVELIKDDDDSYFNYIENGDFSSLSGFDLDELENDDGVIVLDEEEAGSLPSPHALYFAPSSNNLTRSIHKNIYFTLICSSDS